MSPDLHESRQHTCPVGQGSFGEHDWRSVPSHSGLGNRRNGGHLQNRKTEIEETNLGCHTAEIISVSCTDRKFLEADYEYCL